MKSELLQYTVLRTASLLAPGDQRAEWLREWRSELWYVPRHEATAFCLGAFRDAAWLRRNSPSPEARTLIRLESPAQCLAFLGVLAVVSILIAACLLDPLAARTTLWRLRVHDLPAGCLLTLVYTGLLLPLTRLAMGPLPGSRCPTPLRSRLRRGLFLALKIVLVQPILLCVVFVGMLVPEFGPIWMSAVWILTFRWLVLDQRQRCPVCLRLLSSPVRIGSSSHTLLEWYGAESFCSRGHGLLHAPEIAASYAGKPQWLVLDQSWSSLFSPAVGGRQR